MKWLSLLVLLPLVGVLIVGMYVTDFTAYLGNNPTTCNNCHVMDAVYESWFHAGHKPWAECNDCHTPHAFLPKYLVKAQSGYHHVTAFIFGPIPDAIRAKTSSRRVIQENCIRCHSETVSMIGEASATNETTERFCFECHRAIAHGERGITMLPYQHSEEYK
jgi:cytochrome c nitrite reductase small subunit